MNPPKSRLHRRGPYETRRRPAGYGKPAQERDPNNIVSQSNRDRYDNSRYAENEIVENADLKVNNYYDSSPLNGDQEEGPYIDDFTPFIEEENGAKIPILPAPDANSEE